MAGGVYLLNEATENQIDTNWPISWYTIPSDMDYLVVAGGGAGGSWAGGGGGAGGFLTGTISPTLGTTYVITVGAGGTANPSGIYNSNAWSSGFNSSISGIATSIGGGAGATYNRTPSGSVNGGSGGGASYGTAAGTGVAGQGFAGSSFSASYTGGGGGGAGAAGSGKNGGNGLQSSISGVAAYYAGGGAASFGTNDVTNAGIGGLGGGANGINSGSGPAPSGVTNTGGGGASSKTNSTTGTDVTASGAGGSGIVIIRYSELLQANTTGNPTITVTDGYKIYKFTSSGSITFT
jgi:hypothetical protein